MKKHSLKELLSERAPRQQAPLTDKFMQEVLRQIAQHKQLLDRLKDA